MAHSAAMREAIGMPSGTSPWTSDPHMSLGGVPRSDRVLELINIAYFDATRRVPDADKRSHVEKLKVDISQDVSRKPWSFNFKTFTTSAEIYSFGMDRVFLEEEKFFMMGFPKTTRFEGMSSSMLRDLCGDAMALPSVTSVTLSTLLVMRYPNLWQSPP